MAMKNLYLGVLCCVVLGIILTLGLWPFHAPKNDAAWLTNRPGLHLGKHGIVISSGLFQATAVNDETDLNLDIWMQPDNKWFSGTFLSFSDSSGRSHLALRQTQVDLAISSDQTADKVIVREIFRKPGPLYLSLTSGSRGTSIYRDGSLFKSLPALRLTPQAFSGRLVLGCSPRTGDSWAGQLFGLAARTGEPGQQMPQSYETWARLSHDRLATGADGLIALYFFDRHAGSTISNEVRSGADLSIPERYTVLNQLFLEPPWEEIKRDPGYWGAALKNIVGFLPVGFCFYPYLSLVVGIRRGRLATTLLGTLVSLTIEVLQVFVPTRASGTSDLITNTVGTYLGVLSYEVATPILAKTLRWWPSQYSTEDPGATTRRE
jgi:VanZ family protein